LTERKDSYWRIFTPGKGGGTQGGRKRDINQSEMEEMEENFFAAKM